MLYGGGEFPDGFLRVFRDAWEGKPAPVFGSGANRIPTCHVRDLAACVAVLAQTALETETKAAMLARPKPPCCCGELWEPVHKPVRHVTDAPTAGSGDNGCANAPLISLTAGSKLSIGREESRYANGPDRPAASTVTVPPSKLPEAVGQFIPMSGPGQA